MHQCHYRGEDWYRLKRSASEERMEQVREIDGEQAYEKMRRAMEKADQEKASVLSEKFLLLTLVDESSSSFDLA